MFQRYLNIALYTRPADRARMRRLVKLFNTHRSIRIPVQSTKITFNKRTVPFWKGAKWGLPGFGKSGTRQFISGEQGNKGLKWREQGKQAVLGNREHRKSRCWFWRTRESADLSGEEMPPSPPHPTPWENFPNEGIKQKRRFIFFKYKACIYWRYGSNKWTVFC